MVLAANALTTLATIEGELGITAGAEDAFLTRLINSVSDRIEEYCGRSFYRVAAQADSVGGYGGFYLRVARTPLLSIASITFDGETLDSDGYEIDNTNAGMIRSTSGFDWTAGSWQHIIATPIPGTERKLYDVTYAGGYLTPEQCKAKGTITFTGQPTADETMVLNNTTITAKASGATGDQFNIGTSARDTCDNLAAAINAGSESSVSRAERVGLTVIIEWLDPGTDGNSIVLTEAFSNATADGSGTLGGTQAGAARTLPYAVEDACVLLVTKRYRQKGNDPSVKSKKLLSHSVSYGGVSESVAGIPADVAQMLNPYKVVGQA